MSQYCTFSEKCFTPDMDCSTYKMKLILQMRLKGYEGLFFGAIASRK